MQTNEIGRRQTERRIVRLDLRTPNAAVVRTNQQIRVCIDRQDEAATATSSAIVTDVVIFERRVVVPDEQPILIREVLDPVLKTRVVQKSKVVRAGSQR